MARVDYFGIEEAIRDILVSDTSLGGISVLIEDEINFIEGPVVALYLENRAAPAELQSLSAGQRTRFYVSFVLWVMDFSLDGIREASKKRDDLVGKVEIVLMKDRTLGGTVTTSWLEGGDFLNAQVPDVTGFVSAAEIRLTVDVRAATQ